jgi:hypothetical protein
MVVKTKHEGLDTPYFTGFILTAPQLGPELEIYRLDPPDASPADASPADAFNGE